MKLLYHAFPRARHVRAPGTGKVDWLPHGEAELARGFATLVQILEHGILCTPERFGIFADPETEREEKLHSLRSDKPYTHVTQSRACFTLLDRDELSRGTNTEPSHAAIFGPFAIGLDPLRARSLGICPVFYFYRHLHNGFADGAGRENPIAGLGAQIVSRLTEMETVFSILSRIEAKARPGASWSLPEHMLDEMKVGPHFEPRVEHMLRKLDRQQAEHLLSFFDTDRVAAWNIVDFIHMLLSLYQFADSTLDGTPLTFFGQREWRLTFHTRQGLEWFGLGHHPVYRDPAAPRMAARSQAVRQFLSMPGTPPRDKDYFTNCWVLHSADAHHFRDFISEIVVPESYFAATATLVRKHEFAFAAPRVHACQD